MKAPAKIPVPTNMHVILAVVVLYIAAVSADQQVGVIKLNDANFAEEIAHGNWLVDFYSPECSHCITLKPEWERCADLLSEAAALQAHNLRVKVAMVDCLLNPGVCSSQQIAYYPTIKLFSAGVSRGLFPTNLMLDAAHILQWLQSLSPTDGNTPYALPALPLKAAGTAAESKSSTTSTSEPDPFDLISFELVSNWIMNKWIAYPLPIAAALYATGIFHGLFCGCLCALREKMD